MTLDVSSETTEARWKQRDIFEMKGKDCSLEFYTERTAVRSEGEYSRSQMKWN